MEKLFEALFSWQFILFSLAIAGIVFVARKLIEFFILDNPKFAATRQSLFWKTVILPTMPIILGCVLGLIFPMFPFPSGIVSYSARATWGLVSGMFSSLLWQVIIKTVMDKFLPAGSRLSSAPPAITADAEALVKQVSQTINKE